MSNINEVCEILSHADIETVYRRIPELVFYLLAPALKTPEAMLQDQHRLRQFIQLQLQNSHGIRTVLLVSTQNNTLFCLLRDSRNLVTHGPQNHYAAWPSLQTFAQLLASTLSIITEIVFGRPFHTSDTIVQERDERLVLQALEAARSYQQSLSQPTSMHDLNWSLTVSTLAKRAELSLNRAWLDIPSLDTWDELTMPLQPFIKTQDFIGYQRTIQSLVQQDMVTLLELVTEYHLITKASTENLTARMQLLLKIILRTFRLKKSLCFNKANNTFSMLCFKNQEHNQLIWLYLICDFLFKRAMNKLIYLHQLQKRLSVLKPRTGNATFVHVSDLFMMRGASKDAATPWLRGLRENCYFSFLDPAHRALEIDFKHVDQLLTIQETLGEAPKDNNVLPAHDVLYATWLDALYKGKTQESFLIWLEGETCSLEDFDSNENPFLRQNYQGVRYYGKTERRVLKVSFHGNSIHDAGGKAISTATMGANALLRNGYQGWAGFVIDETGDVYVFDHEVFHTHHDSPMAGCPLLGAGMLKTDAQGHIIAIINKSGHYQPTIIQFYRSIQILSRALSGLANTLQHIEVILSARESIQLKSLAELTQAYQEAITPYRGITNEYNFALFYPDGQQEQAMEQSLRSHLIQVGRQKILNQYHHVLTAHHDLFQYLLTSIVSYRERVDYEYITNMTSIRLRQMKATAPSTYYALKVLYQRPHSLLGNFMAALWQHVQIRKANEEIIRHSLYFSFILTFLAQHFHYEAYHGFTISQHAKEFNKQQPLLKLEKSMTITFDEYFTVTESYSSVRENPTINTQSAVTKAIDHAKALLSARNLDPSDSAIQAMITNEILPLYAEKAPAVYAELLNLAENTGLLGPAITSYRQTHDILAESTVTTH